jgi:hypothetical protein
MPYMKPRTLPRKPRPTATRKAPIEPPAPVLMDPETTPTPQAVPTSTAPISPAASEDTVKSLVAGVQLFDRVLGKIVADPEGTAAVNEVMHAIDVLRPKVLLAIVEELPELVKVAMAEAAKAKAA